MTKRKKPESLTEFHRVPDAPNYGVSRLGVVKNLVSGKILTPYLDAYGYLLISMRHAGTNFRTSMHRLMAGMFIPNPEGLAEVDHKDFDRSNFQLENLEWVSQSENKARQGKRLRARKRAAKITQRNQGVSEE